MFRNIQILRDPDPEGNQGGNPAVVPGEQPLVIPSDTPPVIPKTKDEWDTLAKDEPQRWISLTQTRMDQAVRQGRETREKLEQEQNRARNLEAELESFKKGKPAGDVPPENDPNKPFSKENMPKSKDEWDQLWIEDPNLASDLRNYNFQRNQDIQKQRQSQQSEFAKSRKESAKSLWDRHPDMYVQETDESGNIKVDGNGKPVLRIDPNSGGPMLNLESEKGKLFVQVYSEDPQGYDGAKFGPRLAMAEMERRLQESGNQQIQNQRDQNQATPPDQRGVLPGGVTPPVTGKVSFSSDDEKVHATKAVERGIYKSMEEYCQLRDGKNTGIEEEGRTPVFNKK